MTISTTSVPTTSVGRAPIPIDVLAAAKACIRQVMATAPAGRELPQVSETAIRQVVDSWRINNRSPPGAVSLVDKAATLLNVVIRELYEPFRAALGSGVLQRPVLEEAGLRLKVENATPSAADHALFLLEEYRLTSFLGNYGIGRTLNTLSLLPGEETTIRIKTWRTTTTTDVSTSSVVDSEETEVATKFADKLQTETTSTTTLRLELHRDVVRGDLTVQDAIALLTQARTRQEPPLALGLGRSELAVGHEAFLWSVCLPMLHGRIHGRDDVAKYATDDPEGYGRWSPVGYDPPLAQAGAEKATVAYLVGRFTAAAQDWLERERKSRKKPHILNDPELTSDAGDEWHTQHLIAMYLREMFQLSSQDLVGKVQDRAVKGPPKT